MTKYRKMLNNIHAPYLQSFMHLTETQSKETLAIGSVEYARNYLLSINHRHQ